MSKTSARFPTPLGGSTAKLITIDGATATANNDIFDATGSVYQVEIDASLNSGEDVFLRIYDHASPTVGTTDAEVVLKGKAGEKTWYGFPRGIPFATAISISVTKTAGGTAGLDDPSGTVNVAIHVA